MPDDTLEKIQDNLNENKEFVAKLETELPNLVKEVEDKIEQIISVINLDDVTQEIKDVIIEFIGNEVDAEQCIESHRDAIERISDEVKPDARACTDAAQAKLEPIKDQIKEIIEKAQAYLKDFENSIQSCLSCSTDSSELDICLETHVEPIEKKIQELKAEIEDFVLYATAVVDHVSEELQSCLWNVKINTDIAVETILANIKRCVDSKQ